MARANGKVILLGEHAVVYGVPALAVGITRGATAIARAASTSIIRIDQRCSAPGDGSDLGRAFEQLLETLRAPALEVELTSEIPLGSGLGGSAALAVAAARAVLEHLGRAPERELAAVLAAADAWERVFHGNPSGIDVRAAALGGCVQFQRGAEPALVPCPVRLELAIAIAGPPASTKEMVEHVARMRQRRPDVFEKTLAGIESLVKNARLCIESGDHQGLGKLMDLNHMLLSGLFLSTDGIERACQAARDSGALGAKLTGKGGGGCVVALVDRSAEAVLTAWRALGFECFAAQVSSAEETRAT